MNQPGKILDQQNEPRPRHKGVVGIQRVHPSGPNRLDLGELLPDQTAREQLFKLVGIKTPEDS